MSFWSSTPGFEDFIERFLATEGSVFKGPYVSAKLPFRQGGANEFFPEVPLGFPAHLHQEQAFARLAAGRRGESPKSTLVATGTGSGKTEGFLWPILDHCRQQVGTPGIKAILIYPMNSLATDQALRIARTVHDNPNLRGSIRAGLYVGESREDRRTAQKAMGPRHLITDRERMCLEPPDILLTNYKMLDYLFIRPSDQGLWQYNTPGILKYLVVDELHSFDGAQGTDLACLIRRLKARLRVEEGALCCVGTSATLGGDAAADALRIYASDIFGEPFSDDAVIGESRQGPEVFFAGRLIESVELVSPDMRERLDPSRYATPDEFAVAQQELWFEEPLDAEPLSDGWRVALGERLLGHALLRNLLTLLSNKPADLGELITGFAGSSRQLREDPELARLTLVSFLALISEARTWMPEREEARDKREAAGKPRRTRPFLEVRLQLWQRELRRMVASIGPKPELRFSDDLTEAQQKEHLPVVHCRDCGAMGWGTMVTRDRPDIYRTGLARFYRGFFAFDPQVRFLWPDGSDRGAWDRVERFPLHRTSLTRIRDEEGVDPNDMFRVVASDNLQTVSGVQKIHRDCPYCGARGSLALLGFRASTLTSTYIDQLFASTFNDDKKLLTFSDSVQDAAHRAGFFGARTWRFNLRVALQQVVDEQEGLLLDELPKAFAKRWRGSMDDDVTFVSTFLAPNLEWLSEYEEMKAAGSLEKASPLPRVVEQRLSFEIHSEYGHQARIGRSLLRTGCSAIYVDPDRLDAATTAALEPLQNEVGGLRQLERDTLRTFILGALHHLRERGGIDHPELPRDFVQSAGKDEYSFKRAWHLPAFGPNARFPALLTTDTGSTRFDVLIYRSATGRQSWYERWAERCLATAESLLADPFDIWTVVLPALVEAGLLKETASPKGKVWGLAPAALRVSGKPLRLRCRECNHWMNVAQVEREHWEAMPCLTARCSGTYEADDGEPTDYFGRLYKRGEVERVFTSEHTGLLARSVREEVEEQFKAEGEERRPWFPNVLSCTPTLEMGIDIGELSTAILCSVPPAQANYLQRIGRAGRRDGNSLLLTFAQAKPHDLYFFAKPEEMIAGDVRPPGVFLNASAVLERQLAAFCLDRWNAESTSGAVIAGSLKTVFSHLDDEGTDHFPHNWLQFVRTREKSLLDDFVQLFGDRLSDDTKQHLSDFLIGNRDTEGSLGWKVLDALRGERKQSESLRSQAKKVRGVLAELKETKAKDKDYDQQLADLIRERRSLDGLVKGIEKRRTLEFLTDEGLLPNYAFPESPIRLRSVVWRLKQDKGEGDKKKYETKSYDYARPAMTALSELAPDNRFFAGGRRVTIDQVDVATASLENWRFCDQCSHCECVDRGDMSKDCPSCGSAVWGEEGQKRQLLRLSQVFSNTHDRDSRIRDDQEERQPVFYNKNMLPTFRAEDREGAWRINNDAVPFAFEYLKRASFREFNFGEFSDQGSKYSIAGRSEVRKGFVICRRCGKVQKKARPGKKGASVPKPEHTLWCPARKKGTEPDDFQAAVYLYREFASEALRMLLPLSEVGGEKQLHSFVAAFQLGLRDKYGGRVDHLNTLVYSEPEKDSDLRRQYLVLYDTVPGGTGYLKDLTHVPAEGGEPPLFDILERALTRIRGCVCSSDAARDGCYRCLFAYRNSRDMADTSAREAIDLLGRILEQRSQLVTVESLSDVSVSGMMDSILEARFIEAFRRMDSPTRPVTVEKRQIRNKSGYRITIGKRVWNVEPQLDLGPAQGYPVGVSIDFVFHPATTTEGQLPIAVFLDGFAFHRDRVGTDMLQRMALLSGGAYDVWTFTWYDVDEAFHNNVEPAPFLLHTGAPVLKSWLGKLGLGQWSGLFDRPLFELFVDTLGDGVDSDIPWARLATGAVIAQMSRPDEVSHAEWLKEIRERAPDAATPWFEETTGEWLFVERKPEGRDTIGLWAAAPQDAIRDPSRADDYRLVCWLDDSGDTDDVTFRQIWRGYLHTFQYLRALPHIWFVTARGQKELDFDALNRLRSTRGATPESAWMALDVLPSFVPLVEALAGCDVRIPEIGLDLPDTKGYSSGVEGELVWEQERVAVTEHAGSVEGRVSADWTVFALQDVVNDVEALAAAVRSRAGGEN